MSVDEGSDPGAREEIAAHLTWSEVFDAPFSAEALNEQLATTSRSFLLRGLSMIGTVLVNTGSRIAEQRGLAQEILDGEARDRALALFDKGEIQALTHADSVLHAVHLTLKYANADGGSDDSSVFGPLLLGANEQLGGSLAETPDELAGLVLHNFAFGGGDQLRYLVPRYYDLLVRRPSRSGGSASATPASVFETATGLPLEDFLSLQLCRLRAVPKVRERKGAWRVFLWSCPRRDRSQSDE